MDPIDILDALIAHDTDMLVVSGGEPLLQQRRLAPLIQRCAAVGWRIEVETAATISPLPEITACVSQFNVSPKLENSGNEGARRYRPNSIDSLLSTNKSIWKFVVSKAEDLDEVDILVKRHALKPIYIMPEGTTTELLLERSRSIVDEVLARGWNLTTRLHILVWGDQRAV